MVFSISFLFVPLSVVFLCAPVFLLIVSPFRRLSFSPSVVFPISVGPLADSRVIIIMAKGKFMLEEKGTFPGGP